jgi:hypothetical protein
MKKLTLEQGTRVNRNMAKNVQNILNTAFQEISELHGAAKAAEDAKTAFDLHMQYRGQVIVINEDGGEGSVESAVVVSDDETGLDAIDVGANMLTRLMERIQPDPTEADEGDIKAVKRALNRSDKSIHESAMRLEVLSKLLYMTLPEGKRNTVSQLQKAVEEMLDSIQKASKH